MNYKLIISIVPHNKGELITTAAKNSGAQGGTILMGMGTAANGVLQLLGLGDTTKDVTYSLISNDICTNVINSIIEATKDEKKHFGVLFSLSINEFLKAGSKEKIADGEKDMESNNMYQLINVVVNKGYAEDAMAAARKAGAGGGTIINARGTAREDDAKFFGMEIVPEKELLMILVPADKKETIVEAIKNVPCFSQAGSGIIFCHEAADFTLLGKK